MLLVRDDSRSLRDVQRRNRARSFREYRYSQSPCRIITVLLKERKKKGKKRPTVGKSEASLITWNARASTKT